MRLTIDPEFRALNPPLTESEYAGLQEKIRREGCTEALPVWRNGHVEPILVDGHNRREICLKNKIAFQTREMEFPSRDEAKLWILRNQRSRRNLSDIDKIASARKEQEILRPIAKANQKQSKGRGKKGSAKSPNLKAIDTRKEAAESAGVGEKTYDAGKRILEATESGVLGVEIIDKLRRGETSINAVCTDLKRKDKESKREYRRKKNRELVDQTPEPTKSGAKFATIVIDPPWDWGDEGDCDQLGRARPTYATMPIDEIKKLPVGDLADEDCHLYLWITNRSLPKGFALLEAWGFRYVTCLTWCKPSIGMGNYFRGSSEQILFAVKGSQPLKRKNVGTWFSAARGRNGHSSKPTEFYELAESCSPSPYLEMFSRSKRDGWTAWGAEAKP